MSAQKKSSRSWRVLLVSVLASLCASALQQPDAAAPRQNDPGVARSAAIRVLTPRPGAVLRDGMAHVTWELTDPNLAPSGVPTFEVQLDLQDPVRTTDTEHSFTGLTPGKHVISVRLVDANYTPVPNTRVELSVTVPQPRPAPRRSSPPQ